MAVPEIVGEQILKPNPSAVRVDALVLQSAPALGTVTVVWVVLCFVGVTVGFVGSAFARRLSNPVLKYRLLYLGVVFPYGLLAFGALALFDFGAAVRAVLGFGAGFVAAFIAQFATALAAGVVLLATYGPTIRGIRAVRGIELTTTAALGQMARYVLGFAALFSVTITALNRSGGMGWCAVRSRRVRGRSLRCFAVGHRRAALDAFADSRRDRTAHTAPRPRRTDRPRRARP